MNLKMMVTGTIVKILTHHIYNLGIRAFQVYTLLPKAYCFYGSPNILTNSQHNNLGTQVVL